MSEPVRITKYRSFTDEDLLQQLESARAASPVIEELCQRLEKKPFTPDHIHYSAECPVCEANLDLEFNIDDNEFNVKAN